MAAHTLYFRSKPSYDGSTTTLTKSAFSIPELKLPGSDEADTAEKAEEKVG